MFFFAKLGLLTDFVVYAKGKTAKTWPKTVHRVDKYAILGGNLILARKASVRAGYYPK